MPTNPKHTRTYEVWVTVEAPRRWRYKKVAAELADLINDVIEDTAIRVIRTAQLTPPIGGKNPEQRSDLSG